MEIKTYFEGIALDSERADKMDEASLRQYHQDAAKVHESEAAHHEKIDRIYRQTIPHLGTEETFHRKLQRLHAQEARVHHQLAEMPLKQLRAIYKGNP